MASAEGPSERTAAETWQRVDAFARRFEEAWQTGRRPDLDAYLPADGPDRLAVLAELVHIDLERRLKAGEPARAEDYLRRYPELGQDPEAVVELIAAEYSRRQPREPGLSPEEYFRRFPAHRAALGQRLRPPPTPAGRRPAIDSVTDLVEVLRDSQLLRPGQRAELPRLQEGFQEPRGLARELLKRNWLTAFQANQLFLGRGRDIVLGPYILLERLGEGGMGTVFKARHQLMDRVVALKVIRKDRLADAEAVRRFHREIRAAAQLSHPNIVTAYDAAQVGDTHFLVMEYVEGTDLRRLVQRRGPLPVAEACEYVRQAALGLQHAHERGLVHRDLKPANLLLTAHNPTVKILDLGLARLREAAEGEQTAGELTEEGAVMGTPDYMAPEQARESHAVDIRADLYSLGCTLFYLLTGRPPFPDGTLAQKIVKHQMQPPPALEECRPGLPPALGAVVRRLLAKRPEERYQTPAELVLALEPFCWVQPPRAIPAGAFRPAVAVPVAAPGAAALAEGAPTVAVAVRAAVAVAPPPAPALGGEDTLPPGGADSVPCATAAVPAAPKKARPRWLFPAVAGGAAFLVIMSILLWAWRGRSGPDGGRTPLERLDPDQVPAEDRALARLPEDKLRLAAVLGEHRARPVESDGLFAALALSPTGKTLALGENHGALVLADVETLRERHRVPAAHNGPLRRLAFAPDGKLLASGGDDQVIRLWDVDRMEDGRRLAAGGPVQGLAFVDDGRRLLSATADGKLRLWDVKTGRERPDFFHGDVGNGGRLAVAPNGREFVLSSEFSRSGRQETELNLWSLETGKIIRRFQGPLPAPVWDLAYAPDGRLILSASTDGNLRWWDARTGKETRRILKGAPNLHVDVSPDGRLALSAPEGTGSLQLWGVSEGQDLLAVPLAGKFSCGGVFLPDNRRAVFGDGGNLRMLDVETGKELLPFVGHTRPVTGVTFSRDGRLLLSWGQDDTLRLWDLETGRERQRIPAAATRADLFPGDRLIWSFEDKAMPNNTWGRLTVWDVASGAKLRDWQPHDGRVCGIACPADDGRLLTVGYDKQMPGDRWEGSVRRWDVRTGKDKVLCALKDLTPGWEHLSADSRLFAPDGGKVLLGVGGENFALREVGGCRSVSRGAMPAPTTRSVLLAPDGRRWFFGGADGTVGVCDLTADKGKWEMYLRYHQNQVQAIALAADDVTLATADAGGLVILWDTTSRRKWGEWRPPGKVNSLAFAPDGRHLATANDNGTVYVLRLSNPPARDRD